LVEFTSPIGIRFIDLAEELEEILKVKVDLVSKKGVKKKYLEALEPDLV
jgi:predicted nucleotidyltransferase